MNDIFRSFASTKLEFQLNWIDITEYVSVWNGLKQSHVVITFKFFNLELKRKNGKETEKTVTMHLMVQVQCRMFNYIKSWWRKSFYTMKLSKCLSLFFILHFRMRFRTDGSVTDDGFRLHIWPCWIETQKFICFPKLFYHLTLYVLIDI